jgi:hypothetical protein
VVLQARPGRVFADIRLDPPLPRERPSTDFVAAKREILAAQTRREAQATRALGAWW